MYMAYKNKIITCLLLLCFGLSSMVRGVALATSYDSANFSIKDPVLDQGQKSSSSTGFGVGQSVGQPGIGRSSSANFQLLSGFQYYYKVNSNTLTATAGAGQVSLSWTVPQTFLGVSITGYQVGTGTTSGVYTYENVGNVTTFTKSGLTNGTTYYFIVKAQGAGSVTLAYSNEASATPTSTTPGGGGGGAVNPPAASQQIIFQGLAAPKSEVTLLMDLSLAGKTTASDNGQFALSVPSGYSSTLNFVLFFTDSNGLRSNPQNFVVAPNQNPSFQNILLPPTLSGSHSKIKQGEALLLSGFGAPNTKVVMELLPTGQTIDTTTDSNGYYKVSLPTNNLEFGKYETRTTLVADGLISKPSFRFFFEVGKDNIIFTPPEKCGDHNQDGKVNIVDFSILLYWYEKRNPPNRIDCNKDNIINIYDISILMFNWTG